MSEHDDRLVRRVVEAASGRDAMAACPDAEVLGLYAERGLDGDERAGVDAHVAGCARCQATVAAFVRSAPEGVGFAGAGEIRAAWWAGWRWLVPVAATAAVAVVAVWVQRPAGSPDAPQAKYAAPEAAATAQAEPGRAESPAVESATREGLTAGASGRRDSTAAAKPQAPASADFAKPAPLARADASRPTAPSASSPAAPAARPSEERVADARERAAAAPEPAPPAVGTLQETITVTETAEAQLRAKRQADRAEANLADAPPPALGKAVAGSESARVAGAGTLAKQPAQLTGRITYRARAALPEGAVIDVRLLDVSRMDAPATLLGRVEIVTRGEQVPVPFTVGYDAAAIDPRRRYTVQATITIEGRVAYRTTAAHAVLTSGAPAAAVEVVVEPMR